MPDWAGHSRKRADYRFLAIREPLRQPEPGDPGDTPLLPFPTQNFGRKGTDRRSGVVTNRKDTGDPVIRWLRERCGKSEEVHAVMKSDLAGGHLPSGLFGANPCPDARHADSPAPQYSPNTRHPCRRHTENR